LKAGCKKSRVLAPVATILILCLNFTKENLDIKVDEKKLKNPKIWLDDDMIMKQSA